jgi:hypothetical protein
VEFISCNYKKSKPKVHVSVCKACKRRRSCDDYSLYRQPVLFPDLAFPRGVKKTRKRITCIKAVEPIKGQEQLAMGNILKPN